MATQVLQDPRRYLLVVLVVALAGIVPLAYGFIQMMPFGTDSGLGAIMLWVLLGVAMVGLLALVFVALARATRVEEQEHGGSRRDE